MTGALRILSAGAGAGKTYSLSKAIVDVIQSGVPAERIMATTFTIKAADELTERIRARLLAAGDTESAVRILNGYVGTMNSVFGRLLREFALEMGLSPQQTVLPEEEATVLFQSVVGDVIDDYHKRYSDEFGRLQMSDNWPKMVRKIIEIARQNAMDPSAVRNSSDLSWTRLKAVLPPSLGDATALDQALRTQLDFICTSGPAPGDTTKGTIDEIEKLKQILEKWKRHGELNWQEWAQVSKASPKQKSVEHFAPLIDAASIHDKHPRLHQDMQRAVDALFQCAADAMDRYQSAKAKRGLVDFTDQEALALKLLMNPDLEEALRDRISHVFVDEFQDCSPLQLALISRLRELVDGSTWVGDVKQAIFGFRGTDPTLMTEAMANVEEDAITILGDSYRSRESLVKFVNAVFVPVFETTGLSKSQVELNPIRKDQQGQAMALEVWLYPDSKKQDTDNEALVSGVKAFLANPAEHLVEDKISGRLRPVRPSDIAILCRMNDECEKIADALARRGIRATVGEGGLLSTPEAVLAVASFRYLVNTKDSLALAEILHYASSEWGESRWLEPWLRAENRLELFTSDTRVHALDAVRNKVIDMSPTEVFDLAVSAAKVHEMAMAWGEADQRMANLDAVRRLGKKYEDSCAVNGLAATTNGLLLYLEEIRNQDSELNRVADSSDEQAIRIMTYHAAKGLEWPVLILSSLQSSSERNGAPPVFSRVIAMSKPGTSFDFTAPLAGRQLFYWPWPYGPQSKNVGLDGHVAGIDELTEAKRRALEENIRLLYVGMTRARDYLVFATRDPAKASWLKELKDGKGADLVQFPPTVAVRESEAESAGVHSSIRVYGVDYPCRLRVLTGNLAEATDSAADARSLNEDGVNVGDARRAVYVAKTKPSHSIEFKPARFQPSKFAAQRSSYRSISEEAVDEVVTDSAGDVTQDSLAETPIDVVEIGGRIPITGEVARMDQLGDLVHAFLAADNVGRPRGERLALAEELQHRFKMHVIRADAFLDAADRLARFLGERYPDVLAVYREWPIHLRRGLQKSSGWMDLVLETPDGWILIDHKTFPGPTKMWVDKAKSYLPQLQVYATALQFATHKPVLQAWIHMPVVGAMVGFPGNELVLAEFVEDSPNVELQ